MQMVGEGEVTVVLLLLAAAALPALLYARRRQEQQFEAKLQSMRSKQAEAKLQAVEEKVAAVEASAASPPPAPSARARRGRAAEARPPLLKGAKCWYEADRSSDPVLVEIMQVHADVDGAFYTIKLPSGGEKQTTRGKLDSLEERAEAAAAALLAEEAKESKKGGRGKGGSGREKPKPARKQNSGREKRK